MKELCLIGKHVDPIEVLIGQGSVVKPTTVMRRL